MNLSSNSSNVSEISYTQLPAYKTAFALDTYFSIGTVIVCLFGNLAALITICRMRPVTTVSLSVAVLAVADCLALTFKFTYTKLTFNGVPLTDVGCQALNFFSSYFVDYANWIVVLMTLERFIVVWYPLHVSQILTLRRVALGYSLLAIILLPSSLCTFWMYEQLTHPLFGTICYYRPGTDSLVAVWIKVEFCIYAAIPCVSLLILNSLLIYGMQSSSRKQRFGTDVQQKERRSLERQLTIMLLSASIVFLVVMMPVGVFYLVVPYWDYRRTEYSKARYYLTRSVVHILADLNHAINFFVYFLSGGKFRRTFLALFPCRKSDRVNPRSQTGSTRYTQTN